jgi:hypothetical protein
MTEPAYGASIQHIWLVQPFTASIFQAALNTIVDETRLIRLVPQIAQLRLFLLARLGLSLLPLGRVLGCPRLGRRLLLALAALFGLFPAPVGLDQVVDRADHLFMLWPILDGDHPAFRADPRRVCMLKKVSLQEQTQT